MAFRDTELPILRGFIYNESRGETFRILKNVRFTGNSGKVEILIEGL
jgi:hypothetical protein